MGFMELAQKRFSSREYTDRPVEREKVESILEAGRISPTAVNAQPVRVIAVSSPEGLGRISEGARIYGAPLAFIVCADKSKAWVRNYDGMNSAEIDASIVTTQMMLQAQELGLGTCWVCWFDTELTRQTFRIPDSQEVFALLPLGYPAEGSRPAAAHDSRKALEETVVRL